MMKLDIIGDIHGCYDELLSLTDKLGYSFDAGLPVHKDGRQLAFVGDAMDRGPLTKETLEFMFTLQDNHKLIYSPGNHCNKLYRLSIGRNVQQTHGLETTMAELNALPPKEKNRFLNRYKRFYEALPLYENLDGGRLIIAHAGIREQMIGQPFSKKYSHSYSMVTLQVKRSPTVALSEGTGRRNTAGMHGLSTVIRRF